MKTILIPTDFSENSKVALDFAYDFFPAEEVSVIIYHVFDLPRGSTSTIFSLKEKVRKQVVEDIAKFKNEATIKYPDFHKIETLVTDGDFVGKSLLVAKEHDADAIVMSGKGATGLEELFIGSNTADLLLSTKTPLYMVPPTFEAGRIKRMLFSYDGEFITIEQAGYIARDVQRNHLKAAAVHFITEKHPPLGSWDIVKLAFKDIEIELLEEKAESVEKGLEELTEKRESMVVFVKRKKSFWDNLFSSSNSKRAAMRLNSTMLLMPADY